MRHSICAVLTVSFCAIAAGARPVTAQEPATFAVRADVTPCLRVRPRPETSAPSIACLAPAAIVRAVGVTAYWREVEFGNGQAGWVAKRYLELVQSGTSDLRTQDAWLEIHVVDVGQGDGIWIHTFDDNIPGNSIYEGRNIVIDGGPDAGDATNPFLRYLLERAHEGARIDAMLITHPHDDHYPGAAGVLRHFEVTDFYDSGYLKPGPKWANFRALVNQETAAGAPIRQHVGIAHFGQLDWGRELEIEALYAYPGTSDGLGSGNTLENNASIVLRIQYGTQSILLMGDAEGKERADPPDAAQFAEALLLQGDSLHHLRSTVLKIAHHGSETSSTTPFIAAVDPEYVIVSSGRKVFGNRHLPDATTLQRYCDHSPAIRIYRTDEDDAQEHRTTTNDADGDNIVIRMNPTTTVVEAYSGGTRITHTRCTP